MPSSINEQILFSLFGGNKPAIRKYGAVQRWFDEGDIIAFTACEMHLNNAEFQINNSSNWIIWFSQLDTPLYNGSYNRNLEGIQVCSFHLKNGDFLVPIKSNPSDFWNAVKGKRFRVNKVYQCYAPNNDNSEVRRMTILQVYDKVHNTILEGKGIYIKNMLKPQKCYDFEEVQSLYFSAQSSLEGVDDRVNFPQAVAGASVHLEWVQSTVFGHVIDRGLADAEPLGNLFLGD